MQNIQFYRIVDLSHLITPDLPLWPNDPPVSFTRQASLPVDGYYLRSFECLNNLNALPPTGMTLAIRVLRLQAGSKSPVSVLAFVH